MGIHDVSADWLVGSLGDALEAKLDTDLAGRRFCALVEYLQSGSKDRNHKFAVSVIERLGIEAANLELMFQKGTGNHQIQMLFTRYEQSDDESRSKSIWEGLANIEELNADRQTFVVRQVGLIWTMLQLGTNWSSQVAKSCALVLNQVTDPESPWRQSARQMPGLNATPRHAAMVLKYLVSVSLDVAPWLWTSFAKGVVDEFSASILRCSDKESASRRFALVDPISAVSGQRLAFACLEGMATALYGEEDGKRQRALRHVFGSGTQATGEPEIYGRLLAMSCFPVDPEPMFGPLGEGSPSVGDIVRLLRATALGLQADETIDSEQVNQGMAQTLAGFRALVPLELRRNLSTQAKQALDSQFQALDLAEAAGVERSVRQNIRKRIKASQAVIRSLGAGK